MSKQHQCKAAGQPGVHFVDSAGTLKDSGFCELNLNLLAHAQAVELDIGSLCGGHGICGGDRVKISPNTAHLSPPTDAEKKHLTTEELNQGWRLACQCFPNKSDQKIQVMILKRI